MEIWDKVLNQDVLFTLLVFGLPIISIVCITVCSTIAHIIKQRSADELKSKMIEQGMSAEDIERVIKAGTDKDVKK